MFYVGLIFKSSVHFKLIFVSRVTATAAAKSLQSCPTLCDPIDGSPPGSSVPGILQARILEWGAIAKIGVKFHISVCSYLVFQGPFVEETILCPLSILGSLIKYQLSIYRGFISGLSFLFHLPMCLFVCQYHAILITVALQYNLKSKSMVLLTLLFLLTIYFPIQTILWFHIKFTIVFSISVKKCHLNLDRDCMKSIDSFVCYRYFYNINSSNQGIWNIF